MALDWTTGELAAGLACYRNRDFFDAHEHWEDAWNRLEGEEKSFVQGLIQVTVAMHHYQKANYPGARSLLQRAVRRFERCPASFGWIDVGRLSAGVHAWLDAIENKTTSLPAAPAIDPVVHTQP